jgi:hypothetical protein
MRSRGMPEGHKVTINNPGPSRDGRLLRHRGGRGERSDDEMSLCFSSSTITSAPGKRTYRRTTGQTDHTATAIGEGAGRRGSQGSTTTGDSGPALLPTPGKRKRRRAGCGADTDTDTDTGAASAIDPRPLETVADLSRTKVGFTTVDFGAEIMREMDEVERIASVSSNVKGALVRRLRLASRRVRASSAELQQRTVDTSAAASTVAGLCRFRIRDGGVGDDDMRMDESGR